MTMHESLSPSRRVSLSRITYHALLAAFLFISASALAESAPEISWAVQAGSAKHDKTRGLCTDAAGNIYMTGEFGAKATFGDVTVETKGDLDFFVAKYSPAGKCLWVRTGGGTKTDRGYGVAVDAQGNVFATGHCQSTNATFDGAAMPNRGDYDLFVVKYDANGKLLWLRSGGGAGYDYGHSIGMDRAGNCYVTGAFVGDCEFGGVKNTASNRSGHALLAKLTPAGDIAWLRVPRGTSGSAGQQLAVDAEGNTVIAGGFTGAEDFNGLALTNKTGRDVFAVKYDASGKPVWAFKGDGSTNATFASVALDGRGEVCLSGMWQGTLKLGGKSIESHGAHDLLVTKLDAHGKLRWFHTGGGKGIDYALCIAADAAGNCYATGEFTGAADIAGQSVTATGTRDLYVAKFDDAGAMKWLRTAGGDRGSLAYCVALDRSGKIFISGAFDGTATYGKTKLTTKGSNDIMLLKLAP